MYSINKKNVLAYNEEAVNEIYNVDVLVNAIKCCCMEKEFKGEYYGIPNVFVQQISNERNEYLSLLTILSDKIKYINSLQYKIEKELTLY